MRRVVVTGMGIVSSIGNNTQEVLASLREAKSGIVRAEKYAELGFRCQVHGAPNSTGKRRFRASRAASWSDGVGWNYIAMDQAIRDAGLEAERRRQRAHRHHHGLGRPLDAGHRRAADVTREKDPKKVGPFEVPKGMCSGPSAALATSFQIKGVNYSISSACATSAHCIGNAAELIQWGKQDVMFAGGCEELDWTLSVLFDAMGAMSTKFNATPGQGEPRLRQEPRRLRHRRRRRRGRARGAGARQGARRQDLRRGRRLRRHLGRLRHGRAVGRGRRALHAHGHEGHRRQGRGGKVDYINPHGTGTPVGDKREIEAIREVFGSDMPPISSTKSLTGHSLGAVGVQEAIFSLLMMNNGFICESANIDELDPEFADVPIVREAAG